ELLFTICAHAPLRADKRPLLRGRDYRNVYPLLLATSWRLAESRQPRQQPPRLDVQAVGAVKTGDDESKHILEAFADEVLALVLLAEVRAHPLREALDDIGG